MGKLKSTVPGLSYPSGRDTFLNSSYEYLEGRRKDDGAEGLWRINNNLYDLTKFIKRHPGGTEWITLTKGTDITEAFRSHHISDEAENLLPEFFVREVLTPRMIPFTFKPDGFYQRFKQRVKKALEGVNYHAPSPRSKFIADFLTTLTFLLAIAVVRYKLLLVIPINALIFAWTIVISHNFFHMRDNFRMYYFDLSMMSSKEWRISHTLSHHMYPNTIWDMEIYVFDTFARYLPRADYKSMIFRIFSLLTHPVFYMFLFLNSGLKRYYSIFTEWKTMEARDVVPFFLPTLMMLLASSPLEGLKFYFYLLMTSSFLFTLIGLNGAHHHPDIFHDGDAYRKSGDLDWGVFELDTSRERKIIDDSLFVVLTSFGSHGLHHLLPSIDHDYLQLCLPAFYETCREFGIEVDRLSPWQIVKGQYQQLLRVEPRVNYRNAPNKATLKQT